MEGEAEESEAFWLSLVHYRACEPGEDASRKIRRERGRALQLAAKEVERQIARANLDGEHSPDELSDEVLANAVNELLSEDQLHAARVVEGAVDAFTGLPVPSVKLERQVKPSALATVSPIQQQDLTGMTGEVSQNDAFTLQQHDHDVNESKAQVPKLLARNGSPLLPVSGDDYAFRIVEASPSNFPLSASDVERKVLVALDGLLLYDPLTRLSNNALELQGGNRFAIRFIFTSGASHSNQLQLQLDSMETAECLDVDAKIVNACTLCCTAPPRAEYARASLQVVILGGDVPRCLSLESTISLTWGAKRQQIDDKPIVSAADITRQPGSGLGLTPSPTPPKIERELALDQQALMSNATFEAGHFDQGLFPVPPDGALDPRTYRDVAASGRRIRAATKQRQPESPPKMSDSLRSNKVRVVERDCSLGSSPNISNLLRSSKVRVIERDCSLVRHERLSELSGELGSSVAKDDEIIKDNDTLASLPEAELHEAVERLVLRVVKQMSKLARTNADLADELDTPDQHGFGLLHYCALYNLSSVISELLALGAHPDGRTVCPMTPLHLASSTGHAGVVSALLLGGADPSAINAAGRTPHDCAVDRDHFKVASLLEDYQADELRISPRTKHCGNVEVTVNDIKRIGGDFQQRTIRGNKEASFSEPNCAVHSPAGNSMTDHGEVNSENLKNPRNGYSFLTIKTTPSWPLDIEDRAYVDGTSNSTSEINKALLHTAFASLSLHEKCALSIAEPKIAKLAPAPAPVTTSNESSVEVTSVISDSDKESLDVAMSLMGASELRELEDEARVITANVRSWIVRRKYIKVRDAARTLETRWILRKRSSEMSQAPAPSPRNDGISTLSGSLLSTNCTPSMKRQDSAAIALSKSPRHQDFVKFQAASRGMCVSTFPSLSLPCMHVGWRERDCATSRSRCWRCS